MTPVCYMARAYKAASLLHLTINPMISQSWALVKLVAWRLGLGPVAMKRGPRFMDLIYFSVWGM